MKTNKKHNKYLVLKWDDINNELNEIQKKELKRIVATINLMRKEDGKKVNDYYVVNQDESYAEKIWKEIVKGEKING